MKKTVSFVMGYLYVILFFGLVFHTSSHKEIFDKYTVKYFLLLVILLILFVPYIKLLSYLSKTTIITFAKKKYSFTPLNKIFILLFICVFLFLLPLELFLRIKSVKFGTPIDQSEYSNYTIDNLHPFLQHQNNKTDNSRFVNFHINSYGFRGEEIKKTKNSNVYRIFILGGSTVLNKKTPYEKTFAKLLENRLNKYYKDLRIEVLNAGADGYTSEHSLIQYLFNIRDFKPDLIIMWHGINDMTASCTPPQFTKGPYKPDYSHLLGPLHNMVSYYYSPKPIVSLISVDFLFHLLKTSLFSDLLNRTLLSNKQLIKPDGKPIDMNFPSLNEYKRNIQETVNVIRADDIQLIMANQPYLYNVRIDKKQYWDIQWLCKSNNTYPSLSSIIKNIDTFNRVSKSVAEENNIRFVDLESKLPKTKTYFSDDVHFYNAPGNEIVANALFEEIINSPLVTERMSGAN